MSTPVHASQSATSGKNRCTITAQAAVLRSGFITGSVAVTCTVASQIFVDIGVVELDGAVEDRIVEVPVSTRAISVSANKSVMVTTSSIRCISTETGNEELATKSRVNVAGVVSAWDRTAPLNDSFAW